MQNLCTTKQILCDTLILVQVQGLAPLLTQQRGFFLSSHTFKQIISKICEYLTHKKYYKLRINEYESSES